MEVLLCVEDEYKYFEDYIRSVFPMIPLYLYTAETPAFFNKITFWCIRRIPYNLIPEGSKIKFVNTEQLTIPSRLLEITSYITEGIEVYDYSLDNIKILGKGRYIPYIEIPEETEKLKEFLKQPKEYDFAVLGTPSEYRNNTIKTLTDKGYSIIYIHGWNDVRDKEVAKCRNLLNLHFGPEYKVYESIRCERWRFAGMSIYSEPCLSMPEGIKLLTEL
jgi:hypothetical protein